MTTAAMLEARGEARAAARAEARGAARVLIKVLTAQFGPLPGTTSEKVNEASAAELEEWATRAGTAATLDEVFA